jgi:hypothetical protein
MAFVTGSLLACLLLVSGTCDKPGDEVNILEPVNISNTANRSEDPSCAVDSRGTVHVVWNEQTAVGYENLCYAYRPYDGTWSTPESLTNTHGGTEFSRLASLAVGPGDRLHLAWQGGAGGLWRILYMWRDPGGSWSVPETIPGQNDVHPKLAVKADGTACVSWEFNGYNCLLRYAERSPDGTWSTPVALTASHFTDQQQIAVDPAGNVHLVYCWESPDYGRSVIHHKMKPTGGDWSQPTTVSNDTAVLHSHPSQPWLAADRAGNLHVTWQIDIRPFVKHRLRLADGTWLAPVMACSLRGGGGFDPEGVLDPSGQFFIPGRDTFIIDSAGVVERLVFAVAPSGGDPQDTIQGDWVRHLADVKAIACDSTGQIHLLWTRDPPGTLEPDVYWFGYKPR